MKKPVTINDLESAFRALDEIKIPSVSGLRPNRQSLQEKYGQNRIDRTSMLVEDYYNIAKEQDLQEAQELLAQEKENKTPKMVVVDLNAGSAKELQNDYVGKGLIQCPQCMNIFFKDTKDIVGENGGIETVNIGDTVNAGEVCQHCGNDTGYIFGGWVGKEQPEDQQETVEPQENETKAQPEETEKPQENETEEQTEKQQEDATFDLDFGDLETAVEDEQPEEEKPEESTKKEESFNMYFGMPLVEEANQETEKTDEDESAKVETDLKENVYNKKELTDDLQKYLDYINYLQETLSTKKEQVNKETNNFIKDQLKMDIDGLQAELNKALPEKIKTESQIDNLPDADDVPDEAIENVEPEQEQKNESLHEELTEAPIKAKIGKFANKQIYLRNLQNDSKAQQAVADELKKPINENEVEAILNSMPATTAEPKEDVEDGLDNESFNKVITEYFKKNYKNINSFAITNCYKGTNKLIIEGIIKFNSANSRKINLSFKTNRLQEETKAKIRTLDMLPNKELKESVNNFNTPILACQYLKNGLIKAIKLN